MWSVASVTPKTWFSSPGECFSRRYEDEKISCLRRSFVVSFVSIRMISSFLISQIPGTHYSYGKPRALYMSGIKHVEHMTSHSLLRWCGCKQMSSLLPYHHLMFNRLFVRRIWYCEFFDHADVVQRHKRLRIVSNKNYFVTGIQVLFGVAALGERLSQCMNPTNAFTNAAVGICEYIFLVCGMSFVTQLRWRCWCPGVSSPQYRFPSLRRA